MELLSNKNVRGVEEKEVPPQLSSVGGPVRYADDVGPTTDCQNEGRRSTSGVTVTAETLVSCMEQLWEELALPCESEVMLTHRCLAAVCHLPPPESWLPLDVWVLVSR
ncbi:hypothetical protein CSOJ01_15586 [Colletotrichum sojae]|uniref:Uncharacterized protein n=1 Tax=Colletotrichum sojae TaxID=2175907 RepID=A0A8H6IMU0_9PEZI|nr:hypothetical protein CSOJ01_15586 [Colletotrichum sojae]